MAVDGGVGRGLPLEAQLRWRLRLTASPAAGPLRQGPAARPGRRQEVSGTRGWRSGGRPRSPGRAAPSRPVGDWRPAPDPARRSQGLGPGGFRARGPAVPWAPPPPPCPHTRSWPQPSRGRAGRPSCPAAAGPRPLGATVESARPLSPSKATLAPTPPAQHRTPRPGGRQARGSGPGPRLRPRPWRNGGGWGF